MTKQVTKISSYITYSASAMSPDVFTVLTDVVADADAGCDRTRTMQGVEGTATTTPVDNINKRRSRQQNEPNRSSLWINNVGTSPVQMMVLSPRKGKVAGIIMPVFRYVPMSIYEKRENVIHLRHGTSTYNVSYVTESIAEVMYCWFDVGKAVWNEWRTNPPDTLVVVDTLQREEYPVSFVVDPALRRNQKHYLSATTTIRKALWHYTARVGTGMAMKGAFEGSLSQGWDDNECIRRLMVWIKHHRSVGVEHFYIFDNENDETKANLLAIEQLEDVTYLRIPGVHYDAFILNEPVGFNLRWSLAGQVLIENALIRMAYTEWLLVSDSDELFVPTSRFNFSLPSLIRKYETVQCLLGGVTPEGMKPIKMPTCRPLADASKENVFSIDFAAALINQTDHVYDMDWMFRKVILRPDLSLGLKCHFAVPDNDASTVAVVPPKSGFIAHYRIQNFSEELLQKAKHHASEMMDDY